MTYRTALVALMLGALAAPLAQAQPAAPATQSRSADEAILRQFKTVEWPRAYREQDTAALDRMLADDFVVYSSDGPSTKAEEIAWVKGHPWKNDGFTFTIKRLSIYGDTALVVGEGLIRFATGEKPHQTRYTSSNVLVKCDGRWRAVSSHVGDSKDEPLAP